MTRVSSIKKGKLFHVLAFTAAENVQKQTHRHLHTEASLSLKRVQVSTVQKRAVLSAISGAWLPLPDQEMFGFEVKHVSVGLSLPALAVHAFLGVLHHLLRLLYHLRNVHKRKDVSYQVLRVYNCWKCPECAEESYSLICECQKLNGHLHIPNRKWGHISDLKVSARKSTAA